MKKSKNEIISWKKTPQQDRDCDMRNWGTGTRQSYKILAKQMGIDDPHDENYVPGSFGCHEVLHMSLFFAEQIEKQLCEHPSIILNKKWKRLANKSADLLQELYQEIGNKHCREVR